MNRQPIDFSDLEGDLDNEPVADAGRKTFLNAQADYANGDTKQVKAQDKCRACNGTGQFRSKYTGRIVGDCFRCKGTGSVSKGTNDRVEKSRATKAQKDVEENAKRTMWHANHIDVIKYLYEQHDNDFIASLKRQFEQRGSLSERQVDACRKGMISAAARLHERALEHAKAVAATAPAGSGLDLSKVPAGRYAVPGGDTRLKVMIQRPEAPSKWAAFIFVSDAAAYGHQQKYGRQAPGKTYSGKIVEELRTIASDPHAAAVAYGRLTGHCAVCGRKLEDKDSVARGIGPICAGKSFGQ